jgi:hypothetical protein
MAGSDARDSRGVGYGEAERGLIGADRRRIIWAELVIAVEGNCRAESCDDHTDARVSGIEDLIVRPTEGQSKFSDSFGHISYCELLTEVKRSRKLEILVTQPTLK